MSQSGAPSMWSGRIRRLRAVQLANRQVYQNLVGIFNTIAAP